MKSYIVRQLTAAKREPIFFRGVVPGKLVMLQWIVHTCMSLEEKRGVWKRLVKIYFEDTKRLWSEPKTNTLFQGCACIDQAYACISVWNVSSDVFSGFFFYFLWLCAYGI